MERAASYSPLNTSLANMGEPVTLVRSPMLTKLVSGRIVNGSRPLNRVYGSGQAGTLGLQSRTASAIAAIWAGVVPQHPPTRLSQPFAANSRRSSAMISGVSSNPPNALGNPALG